uniref:Putative secreted protein n=1 Tax=Anopheles marajoara TaxID=58244 RepID=A0A2M4CF02_9DIPT
MVPSLLVVKMLPITASRASAVIISLCEKYSISFFKSIFVSFPKHVGILIILDTCAVRNICLGICPNSEI